MTIKHRLGSYTVEFCPLADALKKLPANSFVITDQNVATLYGALIPEGLPTHTISAGEEHKSLDTFARALEWLAASGARRDSIVVALGGGVVGDLAGFVAAAYMRGVPLIQVPTTLLAQVDSSVGGKVGVDLPQGKNLAGAFHAPLAVFVPVDALQTLDDRQFTNGMAEVLKYGFIMDLVMLESLSISPLAKSSEMLPSLIERCIEHKAAVVQEDEFETTGRRAILNFGHTIGHAIEQATEYRTYLHGEAISIGMCAEAVLGESLGVTKAGTSQIVSETLALHGLPITPKAAIEPERLLQAMTSDKKASQTGPAFSLLTEIGGCRLVPEVPLSAVQEVLAKL